MYFLNEVESTQTFLIEQLTQKVWSAPVLLYTNHQTKGIGSQGRIWESFKGNIFFSFALNRDALPSDLPLQSASIYFSFLFKMVLEAYEKDIWIKWPNDFYIDQKKVGGTITVVVGENVVCGIGLNSATSANEYGNLGLEIDKEGLLKVFVEKLQNAPSWKQIFSKYELEFQKSQAFFTHLNGQKIPLKGAVLQADGSLQINGERVVSFR
jgi:BirA family biotin operon repressor/biotin-[acetyl-CoA-carboxylase] ligase